MNKSGRYSTALLSHFYKLENAYGKYALNNLCKPCRFHICAKKLNYVKLSPSSIVKPFPVLESSIDTTNSKYQSNLEKNKLLEHEYAKILQSARDGGGPKAIERHTKKNKKLLVQDRIKLLLDEGSDLLELGAITGSKMEYGDVPGSGTVTAIGRVHGCPVMILANDATVKGGTMYPISVKKQLHMQEVAERNRIPCIYLVDTGGAFLPLQAEIFPGEDHGGRTFYNEAVMSSKKIPQIALVCGSCTAGGAYIPNMADEAIIVHGMGTIFLAGPPLVKAALGEIVSAEDLGGAMMHSSVSGCTDHFAENEQVAFEMARDIVVGLNLSPAFVQSASIEEPLFDQAELGGLVDVNNMEHLDAKQVIARIVDGSRFKEFKAKYGKALTTGFAFINGYLVGIVANNGILGENAAVKGAHFVELCAQRDIPLVFLQNTVSENQPLATTDEAAIQGSTLRAHSKMLAAVSCVDVPKITIIVGNSFGATNYLMGGRGVNPNFLFTWPNSVIGSMDPVSMTQAAVQGRFQGLDPSVEEKDEFTKKMSEKFTRETSALYSSSRGWDDGIILPRKTRKVLTQCLQATTAYRIPKQTAFPVLRM